MASGIRMLVGERNDGWISQDDEPLLFSDKEEATREGAERPVLCTVTRAALACFPG